MWHGLSWTHGENSPVVLVLASDVQTEQRLWCVHRTTERSDQYMDQCLSTNKPNDNPSRLETEQLHWATDGENSDDVEPNETRSVTNRAAQRRHSASLCVTCSKAPQWYSVWEYYSFINSPGVCQLVYKSPHFKPVGCCCPRCESGNQRSRS